MIEIRLWNSVSIAVLPGAKSPSCAVWILPVSCRWAKRKSSSCRRKGGSWWLMSRRMRPAATPNWCRGNHCFFWETWEEMWGFCNPIQGASCKSVAFEYESDSFLGILIPNDPCRVLKPSMINRGSSSVLGEGMCWFQYRTSALDWCAEPPKLAKYSGRLLAEHGFVACIEYFNHILGYMTWHASISSVFHATG